MQVVCGGGGIVVVQEPFPDISYRMLASIATEAFKTALAIFRHIPRVWLVEWALCKYLMAKHTKCAAAYVEFAFGLN